MKKYVRILVLFFALLCIGGWLYWTGLVTSSPVPAPPSVGDTTSRDRSDAMPPSMAAPPAAPDTVKTTVVEEAGVFEFQVAWVGDAVEQKVEVPLLRVADSTQISTGTLHGTSITVNTVADGKYLFDFATSEIYCPPHLIEIKNSKAVLSHKSFWGEWKGADKLLLARGVFVDVVATGLKPADASADVIWWPKDWPTAPKYPRQVQPFSATPTSILLPAVGVRLQLESDKYWLTKAEQATFDPSTDGRRLELTLGTMIPIIIEVYEMDTGDYVNELGLITADDEVLIQMSSELIVDGKSVSTKNGSFGRTLKDLAPRGNAVDHFVTLMPILGQEAVVKAKIKRHGGTLLAVGSQQISAQQREIVVRLDIIEKGTIDVEVVDQRGNPIADVEVVGRMSLTITKRMSEAVGPAVRGRTDAVGKVQIGPVPNTPNLTVWFDVTGMIARIEELKVEDAIRDGVTIVVRTSNSGTLRFSVTGDPWRTKAFVLEGEGPGVWHRRFRPKTTTHQAVHSFGNSSRYFKLVVKADDAYFVREGWIEEDSLNYEFDLAQTTEHFLSIDTTGTLYPYSIDASIVHANTRAFINPMSVDVVKGRTTKIRIEQNVTAAKWIIVPAKGAARSINYVDRASAEDSPITVISEEVSYSTLEVTIGADRFKTAQSVSVSITPIFKETDRIFDADFSASVGLTYEDLESAVTCELPLGRYAVMITYVDEKGTLHANFGVGGRAVFEIRDGVTTKVHLPAK